MHALAARQHREADQPDVGEVVFQVDRRLLDRIEIQSFVGVEVEHHPVGLFDVGDRRSPAMELDRAHLHASHQPVGVIDVQIGFGRPVLFTDVHMPDVIAEGSGVVLLEEAMLAAPLRAADETDRAVGSEGQDERCHHFVKGGKIALGDLGIREDQPLGMRDRDRVVGLGRGLCLLLENRVSFLVAAQPQEARMAQHTVGRCFGKCDFGDEFRRHPMRPACCFARSIDGRRLTLDPLQLCQQVNHHDLGEACADLAGIAQLFPLVHAKQQRAETARFVARRPADDHELLTTQAFDLEPVLRALAEIRCIRALADDAFIPLAAHRLEQLFARTDDVLGVLKPIVVIRKERVELVLALHIGKFGEAFPVER